MPYPRVQIDVQTPAAYVPQETYNDIIVFARAETEPPGTITFNQEKRYRRATDVATDIGEDSDAHVASQKLEAMGVSEWRVIVLEEQSLSTTVPDSDTGTVSSGSTEQFPIAGNTTPEVLIDGTAVDDVQARAVSPPDANEDPGAGQAFYNPDTGAVATGDSTSGAGDGLVINYTTPSWTAAFDKLDRTELDIAFLANVRADQAWVGDLDELIEWASGEYVHVPFACVNGNQFDTEEDALNETQAVAGYLPSADASGYAHKSADDVAAFVAGKLATSEVWRDPSVDADSFPGLNTAFYSKTRIGDPETTGTFEGGSDDPANPHLGAVNVVENVQGVTVLSNDLTTLGNSSNYKYLDVRRLEGFVVDKASAALLSLLLREDDVPFNKLGQLLIHNALRDTLNSYNYLRGPYSRLAIAVQPWDEIDPALRGNRIWGPIGIKYLINGSVHRFQLEITGTPYAQSFASTSPIDEGLFSESDFATV